MSHLLKEVVIQIIASVNLGSDDGYTKPIVARGNTEEEAIEDCLRQLRSHITIDVELAEGVTLPPIVAAEAPTSLPEGYGLLILERRSHCHGGSYDWRFFAVKPGTWTTWCGGMTSYAVGKAPVKLSFLDSNSEYDIDLPTGSMEFVDGSWVPRAAAHYNY